MRGLSDFAPSMGRDRLGSTDGFRPARSAGIDYFRMVAAFMVVAIHVGPFADWDKDLDFLLTYCLSRVAVPFFFMTTGYFVLASYVRSGFRKKRSFCKYLMKNAALYLGATVLYLPLTVYSGNLPRSIGGILKKFFFDGTFYHLWYFPAVILGCILLLIFLRISVRAAVVFAVITYVIGLFGDSYYELAAKAPFLKMTYNLIFSISSYTRNGIFFAPIFLLMGMLLALSRKLCSMRECMWGTVISALFLLAEGYLTYWLKWQRHNSMYLFLLPTMFFLFQLLLLIPGRAPAFFRDGSLFLYVIHPAVIVILRAGAKAAKLTGLLVDHAWIQYLSVCALSLALAVVFCEIKSKWKERGWRREYA